MRREPRSTEKACRVTGNNLGERPQAAARFRLHVSVYSAFLHTGWNSAFPSKGPCIWFLNLTLSCLLDYVAQEMLFQFPLIGVFPSLLNRCHQCTNINRLCTIM